MLPGRAIVSRITYEPTGVAASGVQRSSCGPPEIAAFVSQATLVVRFAVRTASSFTVAGRLRAKRTAAVSRPGMPGETVAKRLRSPA